MQKADTNALRAVSNKTTGLNPRASQSQKCNMYVFWFGTPLYTHFPLTNRLVYILSRSRYRQLLYLSHSMLYLQNQTPGGESTGDRPDPANNTNPITVQARESLDTSGMSFYSSHQDPRTYIYTYISMYCTYIQ